MTEDETFALISQYNEYYAKLIVPTQSEGASITQSGAVIGGDTFAVTSSSGTIEENPYEDYVTRFLVHSDHLEIGVLLGTGWGKKGQAKKGKEPERNIRISIDEVTDLRRKKIEAYPGLVFETPNDVYQLKVASNSGKTPISAFGAKLNKTWKIIEKRQNALSNTSNTDGSSDEGLVDELERLSDLHEKGVLTDEEFEQAKDRLLNS
jgi:hypothetical protein